MMPMKWNNTTQDFLLNMIRKVCGNLFLKVRITGVTTDETYLEGGFLQYNLRKSGKPIVPISTKTSFEPGNIEQISKIIFESAKEELSKTHKSLLNFDFIGSESQDNMVCLAIQNQIGRRFVFCRKPSVRSDDVLKGELLMIKEALEFMINAEIGIMLSHCALRDAQNRNREDLVIKFTNQMAELVKITSYDNIIKTAYPNKK